MGDALVDGNGDVAVDVISNTYNIQTDCIHAAAEGIQMIVLTLMTYTNTYVQLSHISLQATSSPKLSHVVGRHNAHAQNVASTTCICVGATTSFMPPVMPYKCEYARVTPGHLFESLFSWLYIKTVVHILIGCSALLSSGF